MGASEGGQASGGRVSGTLQGPRKLEDPPDTRTAGMLSSEVTKEAEAEGGLSLRSSRTDMPAALQGQGCCPVPSPQPCWQIPLWGPGTSAFRGCGLGGGPCRFVFQSSLLVTRESHLLVGHCRCAT